MESAMHLLEAKELSKYYGKKHVVKSLNVCVNTGEIVGLLGPNGAGKTTTFYMIVGLIKPDGGKISLDNEDMTDLPMYRRSLMGISYLPQEPSIFRKTIPGRMTATMPSTVPLSWPLQGVLSRVNWMASICWIWRRPCWNWVATTRCRMPRDEAY